MRFVFCVQFAQIYSKPRRFFVHIRLVFTWKLQQSHSPSPSRNLREVCERFSVLRRYFLVYGKAPNEILNNNMKILFFMDNCQLFDTLQMWLLFYDDGSSNFQRISCLFGSTTKLLLKQSCHCNLQYFYARSCCPNMYFYVLSYLSG